MVRNSRERSSSVSYERKFICASLTSLPRFGVRSASFPKKGITEGYFAKSDATVLSPPAFGEIALENSAVHCCQRPSFTPDGAALNTGAMAATNALLLVMVFLFSFFSSLFFLLFFLFFPSEFQSALCSVIQRMKLRIGCGSDVSYG